MHDADRLPHQSGVARWADLVAALGLPAVRWRLSRGDWQRAARGVVVLHNGPLTPEQHLLVDVLLCGRGAVLAGITAAERAGLTGWSDPFARRFVLVPHPRKVAHDRSGLVVKSSTALDDRAVLGSVTPPRTRIQRSLVDAAVWAGSDRAAHGVLLAGVQQRLVLPGMLAAEVARRRASGGGECSSARSQTRPGAATR